MRRLMILLLATAAVVLSLAVPAWAPVKTERISFSPAAGADFGGVVSAVQLGVSGSSLSGRAIPARTTALTFVTSSGTLIHALAMASVANRHFPIVSVSVPAVQRVYCLEDVLVAGTRFLGSGSVPQAAVTLSFLRSASGGNATRCASLLHPPPMVTLASSPGQSPTSLRLDCLIGKCTGTEFAVQPSVACPPTGARTASIGDSFLKLGGIAGETPKGKRCGLILSTAHFTLAGGTTTYVRPPHRKSGGSGLGGIFIVTVLRGHHPPFIQPLSHAPSLPKLPPLVVTPPPGSNNTTTTTTSSSTTAQASSAVSVTCTNPSGPSWPGNGPVQVSGSISPAVAGATVSLVYSPPSGTSTSHTAPTDGTGHYQDSLTPPPGGVLQAGSWTVHVSWPGNSAYAGAQNSCSFTVS